MNIYIIVSLLLLLLLIMDTTYGTRTRNNTVINNMSGTLRLEDKITYPKKVTSLKKRPTKLPTLSTTSTIEISNVKEAVGVAAALKNLPEEDLDFITELEKQFQVHGDKIKFKIQHDNVTDTKNSKRTIDGELGYGNYPNGYEYNRPKFMFYPYSQNDISSNAPSYETPHEKTKVTIEPSYSYELKTQTYIEHNNQPHIDLPYSSAMQDEQAVQQHPHQQQYEEPVIVLRIPGPTKYAAHLQTLLQQYLEIRATQYLRILQETDLQKQQQYHKHHDISQVHTQQPHIDLQPLSHDHSKHNAVEAQPDPGYQQEIDYDGQIAPTPPSVVYPATDFYETYNDRFNNDRIQPVQKLPLIPTTDFYTNEYSHHSPETEKGLPQYYYMQEQAQGNLPPPEPTDHNYHNVHYIAMAPPVTYEDSEHHQSPQQHVYFRQKTIYVSDDHSGQSQEMLLSENNPRKTHTKVIFKNNNEQTADIKYPLPSIRPYERHASTSLPTYRQHNDQQKLSHVSETADLNYDSVAPNVNMETIPITQRPFNYHAHPLKVKLQRITYKRGAASNIGSSSTAATSEQVDNRLEKIREYVRDKLGAKKGSTIEFKTMEVIER